MFFRQDNSISQENVLGVLNSKPPCPTIDDSWILFQALKFKEDGTLFWGRGRRLPEDISTSDAVLIGERIVWGHLRNFVDSWLETGLKRDGGESPTREISNGRRDRSTRFSRTPRTLCQYLCPCSRKMGLNSTCFFGLPRSGYMQF